MTVMMSQRQRSYIRKNSAWPVLTSGDDTRVYIAINMKAMERHGVLMKRFIAGFAVIWVCIAIVIAAISVPTTWRPSNLMIIKLAIGVPLGIVLMWYVLGKLKSKSGAVPFFPVVTESSPLFFIDSAKGYAGDLDDCFAIEEIASIGIGAAEDVAYEHKCIAMTMRDGTTHLYAAVHSDWFNLLKVAAQAEEIRSRYVAPATPLPRPTAMGFEMPVMGS